MLNSNKHIVITRELNRGAKFQVGDEIVVVNVTGTADASVVKAAKSIEVVKSEHMLYVLDGTGIAAGRLPDQHRRSA
ncbi:hypothetical protein [Variovorax rhizosphaerae]|uniref:Uncharacterized protein n=1 Tax=Variovorax rhizosphaerae TaxID=1836200 RepID=A0ABU8WYG9_9BURK